MPRMSSVAGTEPLMLKPTVRASPRKATLPRVERFTSRPGVGAAASVARALRKLITRLLPSLKNSRSAAATAISAAMSAALAL